MKYPRPERYFYDTDVPRVSSKWLAEQKPPEPIDEQKYSIRTFSYVTDVTVTASATGHGAANAKANVQRTRYYLHLRS